MSRKRKVVADEDEDPTKIDFETSEEVDVVPTFDQLKLREELLRGVYAYGMSVCKKSRDYRWGDATVWGYSVACIWSFVLQVLSNFFVF